MSIDSLLVCLHPDQHNEGVLDVAIDLARKHNANLTGLGVLPKRRGEGLPGVVSQADALERVFHERTAQVQLSHAWSHVEGHTEEGLVLESGCHDILVIGQAKPTSEHKRGRPHHFLENVLLKSGHPIIAVPYGGSHSCPGDRILIAWNGAREAARATEGAMPILEAAQQVIVLTVDLRRGDATSVTHLVEWLERHDVNVEARGARSQGRSVGEALLSEAADLHCNLLVMGGYGHSRTREHLFGGPTYSVIKQMTVPVLLSH